MEKGKKWEDYNKEPGPGIGGIITQSSVSFDLSATKLRVGDWVKIPRVLPPLF